MAGGAQCHFQHFIVGNKMGEGLLDSLGRRNGDWKLYYADGTLKSEGKFVNGLKEGGWKFYYINGKSLQTGSYMNDLPTGEWKWYRGAYRSFQ